MHNWYSPLLWFPRALESLVGKTHFLKLFSFSATLSEPRRQQSRLCAEQDPGPVKPTVHKIVHMIHIKSCKNGHKTVALISVAIPQALKRFLGILLHKLLHKVQGLMIKITQFTIFPAFLCKMIFFFQVCGCSLSRVGIWDSLIEVNGATHWHKTSVLNRMLMLRRNKKPSFVLKDFLMAEISSCLYIPTEIFFLFFFSKDS